MKKLNFIINIKPNRTIYTFTLLMLTITALEASQIYIVKKGDTLSDILSRFELKPIYGKEGALNKLIKLNKSQRITNKDRIFPGMKIKLPTVKTEEKEILESKNLIKDQHIVNSKEDLQLEFYKIFPKVSWLKISSNSTTNFASSKISTLSKFSYGVGGEYGLRLSEEIEVGLSGEITKISFYNVENYTLLNNDFLKKDFSFYGNYYLSPQDNFGFAIGLTDHFYLKIPSASFIDINMFTSPRLDTKYKRELWSFRDAKIMSELTMNLLFPSGQSVQVGGGLSFSAELKNKKIKIYYNTIGSDKASNSSRNEEIAWSWIYSGEIL